MLRLADNLTLPVDVVTEKLAFLGRTGSGKTYGATKLAEQMLAVRAQVVALDPVGVWAGLRMPGTGPGFSTIYVFGGLYGDFPLAATGGALIADVIVDRSISAVLDVSQFIASEQAHFAYDFATRFFQRKKAAPSAVHLFIEECQEFIPQNVSGGGDRRSGLVSEAHMLHAFERLWKLGRNFGIGGSLVSQRPQEVNKKALNQAGTLFVFQMTGPQERAAIKKWVAEQGISEDIDALLPKLRVGEPHVWSPTFLGISKTVRIGAKLTADISSTPKIGTRTAERPLTPVDLKKLETEMADSVERAKADDPKALRRQVAELKRELAAAQKAGPAPAEPVKVPVLEGNDLRRAESLVERVHELAAKLTDQATLLHEQGATLKAAIAKATAGNENRNTSRPIRHDPPQRSAMPTVSKGASSGISRPTASPSPAGPDVLVGETRVTDASGQLVAMARKLLIALAQHPAGLQKGRLLMFADYSAGGAVSRMFAALTQLGWVEAYLPGALRITTTGLGALGHFDPLPVGADLRAHILAQADNMARAFLTELFSVWPEPLAKNELLRRASYSAGGAVSRCFARLVRIGWAIPSGPGQLKAADDLFD